MGNLGRDRARRANPSAATLDGVAGRLVDAEPGPERVVTERESVAAWQARMAALPPRYRRAVELRHVDGLTYPELAEALGRPLGTVKSDVHRGVRLLRDALLHDESIAADRGLLR